MQLITISGVDGSGKSTQLRLLQQRLEQEDKKIFYFHAIEFSSANKISRWFTGKKEFAPGQEKASIRASWISLQLRKLFLLIDIFRFRDLVKKLEQKGFDCILSDRYFYDSFINIEYLSQAQKPGSRVKPGMTLCEKYIPKPDFAFYLNISSEEIIKRERVPEQGIDYLQKKISLFKKHLEPWDLIRLDAMRDQEHISEQIRSQLK